MNLGSPRVGVTRGSSFFCGPPLTHRINPHESRLPFRLSTLDYRLASGAAFAAVVGGGGDAHAAEFVGVILAVEDVPLFAALKDLFFLRGDAFADFGVGFFFFFQRGGKNLHDLLTNGVAVLDKLHLVAGDQHFGNLMRQANDFFPAESHARGPALLNSARREGSICKGLPGDVLNAAPACGPAPTAPSPFCTTPDRKRRYAAFRPGAAPKSRA